MNYEAMTKGVLMTCVECRGFVQPKGRQVQVYVRRRVSDLPLLCNCWEKVDVFCCGIVGKKWMCFWIVDLDVWWHWRCYWQSDVEGEWIVLCDSLSLDEILNGFVYIEQIAFFSPVCMMCADPRDPCCAHDP